MQLVFKRNLWTYNDGSRNGPTPPSAASAADDTKWRRRAAAENWLKAFSFPTLSFSLEEPVEPFMMQGAAEEAAREFSLHLQCGFPMVKAFKGTELVC